METTPVAGHDVTTLPPPPQMLHHVAYVTHDCAATVDFYSRIMGLKLCSAVMDDEVPSTGDPYPYIHLFFELGDGSTVAFFEPVGLPKAPPISHPAYDIFNHLALDVGTVEAVDLWVERLRGHGVEVTGPTNHGIIYSIYFYDPNGIRLELTATTVDTWKNHGDKAQADIDDWIGFKSKHDKDGLSYKLAEWIRERRRQHRSVS